jgi:sec-independent protein translocase protein TatA
MHHLIDGAARPHALQANIGMGEMIIILIVVLIVFGANKLPQLGDALGRSVKNFKRGLAAADEIDVSPAKKEIPDKATSEAAETKRSS